MCKPADSSHISLLILRLRYAIFHPLAYLVKLNIEMAMADLIKKIALENVPTSDNISALYEFATSSFPNLHEKPLVLHRRSLLGLSFATLKRGQTKKAEEICIKPLPRSEWIRADHKPSQTSTRDFSDGRSIQSNDLDLVLPSIRDSRSQRSLGSRISKEIGDEEKILKSPEPALQHR